MTDAITSIQQLTGRHISDQLSRKQRREMERLAHLVDKATEGDRLFFERHPERKHRIRASHGCEIEQGRIMNGGMLDLPPGRRWFTVVRNVCRGVRLRQFLQNFEDAETDLPEALCREMYEAIATPRTRQIEAAMRAAVCGGAS